ncbi:hypothetical protein JAAARDRAFT_141682 [Jaapia argillacea MUCL 33604]|uniref:Uncharacterized protein n=1 Tax=Jaapia argillacea MUCL 33604 TaxID=933084 RepID=A0A067PHQ9_9AGAM|nr:hypothetical protein JAAARDRAFT_141682 [Jaapia argillacea MUCL 33604]
MADPTNALFSAFAFIGFIITLIPLPWHLEAWNSGTCYFMIWTSLGCLNQFINSIIWRGNALNSAPVWCDISTRLTLGVSVAIPAASLCINRRLYQIAKIHAVVVTRADKRRAIFIDSILCFLIPVLVMALYYVVQGHRFDIFEDVGCYPVVYDTLLSYFLINMWPLIFGLVSAVYCSLSIYSFSKRRASFNEFMTSNKSITVSRYFRLMALAMTDLLCTVPFALYSIWLNASVGVQKWVSWSDTHFDFSRVDQFPSVLWHLDQRTVVSIELTRWLLPVCAILFFLYFGFASEARRHYRVFFYVIAKPFGIKPPTKKPSGSAAGYASFTPVSVSWTNHCL